MFYDPRPNFSVMSTDGGALRLHVVSGGKGMLRAIAHDGWSGPTHGRTRSPRTLPGGRFPPAGRGAVFHEEVFPSRAAGAGPVHEGAEGDPVFTFIGAWL